MKIHKMRGSRESFAILHSTPCDNDYFITNFMNHGRTVTALYFSQQMVSLKDHNKQLPVQSQQQKH